MPSISGLVEVCEPYVREFGLFAGLRMGYQMRKASWASPLQQPVSIAVPGVRLPVWLRARTSDRRVFDQVFLSADQAFPLPESPKVIVDLGANIGLTSVLYCNAYPSARVIAVEPEQSNYGMLNRNLGPYRWVTTLPCAVWSRDSWVRIVESTADAWAFQVEACERGEDGSIEALSIPSIMERAGISHIDLLKIDIEGAEVEVLSNDTESWVHQVATIAVELHDRLRPGCSDAFVQIAANAKDRFQHGEYSVAIL